VGIKLEGLLGFRILHGVALLLRNAAHSFFPPCGPEKKNKILISLPCNRTFCNGESGENFHSGNVR
ncbi:hypothetical protein, partial [uncultured Subdoligranulum sp.]|uniref:hypothetical protein n=1 Tax=uncultured Subdoligranulum sp. TaxID=512298 RepID=UPI0025F93D26